MFEKKLQETLQKIFKVKKVTYDLPGETQEQQALFVEIETSVNSIKDGKEIARVTGNAYLFGTNEQVPFGFFSKAIAEADPDLTKDFFFYDFESNARRYLNKVQRGLSFVYFFDGQYDPETGSITSVEFTLEDQ